MLMILRCGWLIDDGPERGGSVCNHLVMVNIGLMNPKTHLTRKTVRDTF